MHGCNWYNFTRSFACLYILFYSNYMKISRGQFKNTVLTVPDTLDVKPMSSKVKQAICQILTLEYHSPVVWDLFAGSGSLGLELASINAKQVIFFDNFEPSIAALKKNVALLQTRNCSADFMVLRHDLINNLHKPIKFKLVQKNHKKSHLIDKACFADIVFCDPPYHMTINWLKKYLDKSKEHKFLPKNNGTFVLKASKFVKKEIDDLFFVSDFKHLQTKIYGRTAVFFYSNRCGYDDCAPIVL